MKPNSHTNIFKNIETSEVHHWPIVRAYAEKIGLVSVINKLIGSEMGIDPGTLVLGLVIDTLSGRSPLYHLKSFFLDKDTEVLLGKQVDPQVFNDDNVGRVLDKLFEFGTTALFSAISMNAVKSFDIPTNLVHFDTTSINLDGDYRCSEEASSPFKITHGYSKDKRPDLQQFVYSMLCVGGNVPIFGKHENGNRSDKTINNDILSMISQHMKTYRPDPEQLVYIADSAVVTKENLKLIGDNHQLITRLPATYKECERVIKEACEEDQFEEIGSVSLSKSTKNRPTAQYKLYESTITLYENVYRVVVVHSSAHDKRRHKRLKREIDKSIKQASIIIKEQEKKRWFCLADVNQVIEDLKKTRLAFHTFETILVEDPVFAKGRPRKDGSRKIKQMRYALKLEVKEKSEIIEKRQVEVGCFVLLTNIQKQGNNSFTAKEILISYKEQYGIEKKFGFLKDDAIVNALFLKKPERIEAIGLILLISLLIWRLMEHQMRDYLKKQDKTICGWDNKPTRKPTSYMLTIKFKGILILKHGNQPCLGTKLNRNQLEFLEALKLSESIFALTIGVQ